MNDTVKRVGRPIEKEGRVKIGLSICGETNEILSKLAADSGKTKSRIFEEAIRVFKEKCSEKHNHEK